MKLEELETMEATKTEQESAELLLSITVDTNWLVYQSKTEPLTLYSIRRYLSSHAKMPGIFIKETCGAPTPLGIIRFRPENNILIEGSIFMNGAVIRMKISEEDIYNLFIDPEDAKFWNYPETEFQCGVVGESSTAVGDVE